MGHKWYLLPKVLNLTCHLYMLCINKDDIIIIEVSLMFTAGLLHLYRLRMNFQDYHYQRFYILHVIQKCAASIKRI